MHDNAKSANKIGDNVFGNFAGFGLTSQQYYRFGIFPEKKALMRTLTLTIQLIPGHHPMTCFSQVLSVNHREYIQ